MIPGFILQNLTTYEKVSFGQTVDDNYIYNDGDIDWGNAPADHSTYSFPNQTGSYISNTKIKERDVTISGYCFYVPTNYDIRTYGRDTINKIVYENIKEKKDLLNRIVNPNDYISIKIGNYYLFGKPNESVKYGSVESENNKYFCKFYFTLFCNNPMFIKYDNVKEFIGKSLPMFHFPLTIPTVKGIMFGRREEYSILPVENEGNTDIGAVIFLKAKGEVKNPKIENLSTNESFVIQKTMQAGEEIIVTTLNGAERGIEGVINSEHFNYFRYWDFENDWIIFPRGTSLIAYSTDNQSENLLDVSIDIKPEMFALEEM